MRNPPVCGTYFQLKVLAGGTGPAVSGDRSHSQNNAQYGKLIKVEVTIASWVVVSGLSYCANRLPDPRDHLPNNLARYLACGRT